MKKIDVKTIADKNAPVEKKTMKKIAPAKASVKAAPVKAVEKKTMKKTAPVKKASVKKAPVAKAAAAAPAAPVIPAEIAALLATYGIEVPAAPAKAAPQKAAPLKKAPVKAAPAAPAAKAPKAERTYTTSLSSADFSKELFSAPLTEEGCEYYNARVDVIKAIIKKLAKNPDFEDILADIESIEGLDDLIDFLQSWGVGRRASRVIMQLVSPVVCVCCEDTERLASECYGIPRANGLMGSCHNSYICSKWCQEDALPFERTCCNFSTICSDIEKSVDLCTYYFYNLNK